MVSGFCLTLLRFLSPLGFYVISQSRTNRELGVIESILFSLQMPYKCENIWGARECCRLNVKIHKRKKIGKGIIYSATTADTQWCTTHEKRKKNLRQVHSLPSRSLQFRHKQKYFKQQVSSNDWKSEKLAMGFNLWSTWSWKYNGKENSEWSQKRW